MSAKHFLINTHQVLILALITSQKSCKICFQSLWLTLYILLRNIFNFSINQDKMQFEEMEKPMDESL